MFSVVWKNRPHEGFWVTPVCAPFHPAWTSMFQPSDDVSCVIMLCDFYKALMPGPDYMRSGEQWLDSTDVGRCDNSKHLVRQLHVCFPVVSRSSRDPSQHPTKRLACLLSLSLTMSAPWRCSEAQSTLAVNMEKSNRRDVWFHFPSGLVALHTVFPTYQFATQRPWMVSASISFRKP